MKNTRVFVPIAILIIFLGLVFTLTVFKSLLSVKTDAPTSTNGQTALADNVNISDSTIYFEGIITSLPNVPQKTVINPKQTTDLNVYWIQETSEGGNDTCTLYDTGTRQIYASRYKNNGQFSGRSSGSMYYINKTINQKKSLDLLDNACFKD